MIAALGSLVALLLVAMKILPAFPGHFSRAEWIALGVWLVVGATMHFLRGQVATRGQETAHV